MYVFTASTGHVIYMGKDKYENEDLIRFGLPEDVWFHVDDLSSAHVYLRMKIGEKLKELPPELIMECCHLVKANSIEGCKKKVVDVVYTRWMNLKKTNAMEVGQVGFKDESKVFKVTVEKDKFILNRLNRTKKEEHPDISAIQEARMMELREEQREHKRAQEKLEKEARQQSEEAKKMRSYESLFKAENLEKNLNTSNRYSASDDQSCAAAFEDDFM